MINRNFVVISQQDAKNDPENMILHRYTGKTHMGTLKFALSDIDNRPSLVKLVEDYRSLGNKIFGLDDDPQVA